MALFFSSFLQKRRGEWGAQLQFYYSEEEQINLELFFFASTYVAINSMHLLKEEMVIPLVQSPYDEIELALVWLHSLRRMS